MYRKVYDKQAAETTRLQPLKVEDLQAEIGRLKTANAHLRELFDDFKRDNITGAELLHGLEKALAP